MSVAQVYTGLLLVDTSPLKQALAAKAAAGEQALLDQLQSKTMEVARRVCLRCEELSAKALAVSTSVRSVLELKVRGVVGGSGHEGHVNCNDASILLAWRRMDASLKPLSSLTIEFLFAPLPKYGVRVRFVSSRQQLHVCTETCDFGSAIVSTSRSGTVRV